MNETASDIFEFRKLAELYAQGADRNRPELFDSIMADDAVVEGPDFKMVGVAEIRTIPEILKSHFRRTRHEVHNQSISIEGGKATGETYCTASHLLNEPKDGAQLMVWHVRYQDMFGKQDGRWVFQSRKLEIDWTEMRAVASY